VVGVSTVSEQVRLPAGGRDQLPRGLRLWYAVTAGVFWWAVHVWAFASMARLRCLHPNVTWVLHAITVVTALGTLLAMWWSWQLWREGQGVDDGEGNPLGLRNFLGMLGLLTGLTNLLLILWESGYVFFMPSCG
jgi:hypothetical protein